MTNRVALVTGGAQGIGRGIAEQLGTEGFRVGVADLNLEAADEAAAAINAAGGRALAVQIDVTDTASVQAAVKAVTEEYGTVEVLVNNAGFDDFMKFLDTTEDFWDRILEVNFKG
ncbi:MAG: 3-oxoacyl-(acyl-carrier-protein) reductase, partial [Pseudonocardiales bacterium]|nr:3-oxoacyl-(acyl-carrier-protein) reductase [Pseudonocardiales bacterium]